MDIFSALAEPTRRNILEMLAVKGRLSARDISEKFSVSPAAISQHLKVLREASLVRVEKRAQQRIYEVNPDAMLELEGWAKKMAERWDDRFNALEEIILVDQEKKTKEKGKRHGRGKSKEA